MKDSAAVSALEVFSTKLKQIAEPQLRQIMTYDQGIAMALHKELTGVQVYFCDPHSPGQRGMRKHKRFTKTILTKRIRLIEVRSR